MDKNEYAKQVYGLKVGDPVSPAMGAQIEKELEYYRKKKVDALVRQQFEPAAQPVQPPQFMSLTNSEGRVIDVLVKPDGTPQVVEPKVQNTQQGIMTMVNPTNAVPMVNPQTGQPLMGYAADPMMGGMPQPGIGGAGMAVTNAPTAAPVQTPAPSPTPAGASSLEGKKVVQNGVTYLISNNIPHVQINGQWVPQR
jgi:hypothetical protein